MNPSAINFYHLGITNRTDSLLWGFRERIHERPEVKQEAATRFGHTSPRLYISCANAHGIGITLV